MNKVFAFSTIFYTALALVLALLSNSSVSAQPKKNDDQLFGAAIVVGGVTSQIRGDNFAGYHKIGVHAGVRSFVYFSDLISGSFELNYIQLGSRTNTKFGNAVKYVMNYAEVPFLINIHDKNRGMASAGFSYSRLMDYKKFEGGYQIGGAAKLPINSSDWRAIIELSIFTNEKMAFSVRYTESFIPIARWPISNARKDGVANVAISGRLMYWF